MSDNNLKDKLQGFNASYNPQDWENMSALLDKEEKRRGIGWWWIGGALLLAFLMGSASTYLFFEGIEESSVSRPSAGLEQEEVYASLLPVNEKEQWAQAHESQIRIVSRNSATMSGQEAPSLAVESAKSSSIANSNTGSTYTAPSSKQSTQTYSSAPTNKESASTITVSNTNSTSSTQSNIRSNFRELPMEEWSKEETLLAMNQAKAEALGLEIENSALASNELEEEAILEAVESPVDDNNLLALSAAGAGFGAFFELGAGMMSTWPNAHDGGKVNGKYGFRFGLGYGRFYITSGLLYSNFKYGIDQIQCDPNYPYQCPTAMQGQTEILEVPIAFRVDAFRSNKVSFWVEAGASYNYKINENFDYDFPPGYTVVDGIGTGPGSGGVVVGNQLPPPPNNSMETINLSDFMGVPIVGETRYLDNPTALFAPGQGTKSYWSGYAGMGVNYYPVKRLGLSLAMRYHRSFRGLGDQPDHLNQVETSFGVQFRIGR